MRTSSRRRALAAALSLPLLMLGVVACSEDTPKNTSSGTTTDEPTPTPTESSEPSPSDDETDTASGGGKVADPAEVFTAMQKAMQEAGSAKVAMDTGMGSAKGAMTYGSGAPEMALTMDLGVAAGTMSSIEMRLVDGVMYMSMPPLTPSGKFFKFDENSKTLGSLVEQMQSFTPDESTKIMAKSVESMRDLGTENIGADDVTHYQLVVDTKEASGMLGTDDLPEGAEAQLPETLEYDMWVTKDDLMRRVVMNLDAISMQLDYTDWGKPVTVKAPSADDIVAAPKGL